MNKLIHSPEGMRDILGTEYERKMDLCDDIGRIFRSYGYQFMQTPALEFIDVYEKDKRSGSTSAFYKLFDRDGHTLALRPDFTPSIARAVSMYYPAEEMPLRICYKGNVYLNYRNYRGRLNETTEMGVELLNDDSPAADAEVIAMAIDIMKSSGLSDFRISIGNAAYFRAIAKEAELDEDTTDELKNLLTMRNQYGAMELIEKQDIDPALKAVFMEFITLFGDAEVLERAAAITDIAAAKEAVERLKAVCEILKLYGYTDYLSFDLGMLSNYSYYTGILFQALTYGTGDAIIKGGRYDNFVEKFGKKAPAVGFTTRVDEILAAKMRRNIEAPPDRCRVCVIHDAENTGKAFLCIRKLRASGKDAASLAFHEKYSADDYVDFCRRQHFSEAVFMIGKETKSVTI